MTLRATIRLLSRHAILAGALTLSIFMGAHPGAAQPPYAELGELDEGSPEEQLFYGKPRYSYLVREGTSVIGELAAYRVQRGDTLFDIARHSSLGYQEIVDANPGLDVWLPPPGAATLLPTSWILPCCERKGLVINIPEMRLYYYRPFKGEPGVMQVVTYPVGLGREEWQTPRGKFEVRSKTVDPTWIIPDSIREERMAEHGDDRKSIAGGAPDNPLGRHRLALTLPSYAIHGTNIPWGVGMKVSHGCVRLYPEDVERLFPMVPVGTPGEFVYQPIKVGVRAGVVYVEVNSDIYGLKPGVWKEAMSMAERLKVADGVDPDKLRAAIQNPSGIPVPVSRDGEVRRMAAARRVGMAR